MQKTQSVSFSKVEASLNQKYLSKDNSNIVIQFLDNNNITYLNISNFIFITK